MQVFIGARVRINQPGRPHFHGAFGVVTNTVPFNKAKVHFEGYCEQEVLFDFGNLEAMFDKFDRVQAFGPNCEDHGRGQVLRQIPADAGTYVGWFEVQLDREPVGSTRNYRYDDLRFIEACPHVDDFRIGDHVEILESDPCYAGKRGVVRAFRSGQVEVDFGDEKGTHAHAKDLMKVVDTVQSQQRILEQISNGIISKKTACDILGVPEEVVDTFTRELSGLFPRGPKQENPMNMNKDVIFRVDVANVEKRVAIGRAYGMSEKLAERAIKELYNGADPTKREAGTPMGVLKTTVSATIVLASGREVRMPDPKPEDWALIETRPLGPASRVRARLRAPSEPETYLIIAHCAHNGQVEEKPSVMHAEGRCWLKDMTRIVNMTEKVDPFTTKYAYVTELRFFQERVVEAELDSDRPYPTLRAYLW